MDWHARKHVWRVAVTYWWYKQKRRWGVHGVSKQSIRHIIITLAVRLIKHYEPEYFNNIRKAAEGVGMAAAQRLQADKNRNKQLAQEKTRRNFRGRRGLREVCK